MNRIAVRFTLAMLAMVLVTILVEFVVVVFLIYTLVVKLPENSQKSLLNIFEKLPETFEPFQDKEIWVLLNLELAAIIVAVIVALVVAQRVTRPLLVVSKAASRVAAGDLSARALLQRKPRRGGDETAKLVRDFNAMADALEKLESERKATSAAIAHELRTPLTILRGRLEAIRDGVIAADENEFENLLAQTDVLSRLVTDLRTLSLADAGQLSLERHQHDLRALLGKTVNSFERRAAQREMRLEFVAKMPELVLSIDANRIMQAVGNLIENAIRYAPDGGLVRVSLEANQQHAVILVRDSGQGIEADKLERIFERFYRTDASRSRFTGGSGLGLAIVRAILELHGGEVEVRNHPEGGAEFVLRVPLTPEATPVADQLGGWATWLGSVRNATRKSPKLAENDDLEPSSLLNFIYLMLAFPLGLAYFVMLVIGMSLGTSLSLVFLLGLPLLAFTLWLTWQAAALERWLNEVLLGVPVPFTPNGTSRGLLRWTWAQLVDPAWWRSVIYLLAKFVFGLVALVITASLAALVVGLLVAPVLHALEYNWKPIEISFGLDLAKPLRLESAIGIFLGVVLALLTALFGLPVLNALARGWALFARAMLSRHNQAILPDVEVGETFSSFSNAAVE